MLDKVLEFIKKEQLVQAGETVAAGVSGGADSICLLSVLYALRERLGIRLAAVHVNHGIRGAEADRDEAFVRSFCKERGIPCLVYHRDVPRLVKERHLSEEEAGRMVRLLCFREAMEELGAGTAAVAHNRDDNAETVLFHLFRGSGLKGLAGMAAKTEFPGEASGKTGGFLIRPLLDCSRQEIEDYLKKQETGFCTDSTNLSEAYSRNRIRLNILPQARLVNTDAVLHIVQAAKIAGKLEEEEQAAAGAWVRQ